MRKAQTDETAQKIRINPPYQPRNDHSGLFNKCTNDKEVSTDQP